MGVAGNRCLFYCACLLAVAMGEQCAAKATIEKEENRLLRIQAHKVNSERNRVPEYSMNSKKKLGDKGVWVDRHGVMQEDKPRYHIIAARHRRKVKEYRIMSHGGKGLENVNEEDWPEYINLKPYDVADEDYVKQNEEAPTLEIAHTYGKRKIDWTTSVVRLSDPVVRDIDCDELEKAGQLTEESLEILLEELRKMEGRDHLAEKEGRR
ncbi:hypothetical protein AC579_7295 [Pseudocercospora musae]|uniref:Uncharacterized protein n=1 Tax=Pseudocercospora musae TaxID=113226 RepID=A0A139I3M0_9PEZI|nr:hypothetical protein AC579_7295 [Pseudocercospora musae]